MDTLHGHLLIATNGKYGLEIGGPSNTGHAVIYPVSRLMDNVVFSDKTVWANHTAQYRYYASRVGAVHIHDATALTTIKNATYDFLFASHALEHIANPLKALSEWIRVVKPGGHIILILPERSRTFDHRRSVSRMETLIAQAEKNVGEDDLSTLDEILRMHDLTRDTAAGTFEQFKERSLKNLENRCLHHYVYDVDLLHKVCAYMKGTYVYSVVNGIDIWYIFKTAAN